MDNSFVKGFEKTAYSKNEINKEIKSRDNLARKLIKKKDKAGFLTKLFGGKSKHKRAKEWLGLSRKNKIKKLGYK